MDRSHDTDSLCAFMEQCTLAEKEKGKFQARLTDFPHSFQLQEQVGVSTLERLKAGLESALSVGYKTNLENARARNMLAYLLYRLDRPKDALDQLELVLRMEDQKKNLVTLANKAVILNSQMHLSEADDLVEFLGQMKTEENEFPYLVVLAKAELAFACTRLGPNFFPQAITTFEEVIPKAKETEKWLWKFGLALTRRRLIRLKPQHMATTPSEKSAAENRDLLRLLLDIRENCKSRNLKAKAYSELALLLFNASKTPLRQEFFYKAGMNVEQACEKALELDPEDNSVLCKCGRMFRYRRQTERSCKLLEKALTIRPSSTGYHHLGITYKALACSEKYRAQEKPQGYSALVSRMQTGPHGARSHNSSRQFRQPPFGRPQFNRNVSAQHRNTVNVGAAHTNVNDAPLLSQDRNVRNMQRKIKSPPRGVTQFTRNDKYIEQALANFHKAIEFSRGGNMCAIYDLALLQKSLGELEEAMEKFQDMLNRPYRVEGQDKVCVYEQMGLIWRELAESETDEEKKRHMSQNSTAMLQMALTTASDIFSGTPGIKEHIGELYHSFPVLLQEIEQSGGNHHWKLQEKAKLFQLIKDHKQSLDLLQEIEQMDPEKSKDPKYLKLCIEEYIALGQTEKALAFVKLLKCTSNSAMTMQLFEDKNYVMKIRMRAANQALLKNDPSLAKEHFSSAFSEAVSAQQNEDSSSECESTDSSEESGSDTEIWDVAIVHEETEESWDKAIRLSSLLEDVCGLKVALTGRDAPPNKFEYDGVLRILKKSTVVLVLAGGRKISKALRLYINNNAYRKSTITLLVDGDRVPSLLKANRKMTCPHELLQMGKTAGTERKRDEAEGGGKCQSEIADQEKIDETKMSEAKTSAAKVSEIEVDAICHLFSFLVNIDMEVPEE